MKKDIRTYSGNLEVRASDDGEMKIEGYASVFNSRSELLGWYYEYIEEGFFDDVLTDDVRALFNHDANYVLGRTVSNTLSLSVDNTGLRYTIDLPCTSFARDLCESMKRGDIDQSSFGFVVGLDRWEYDDKNDIYIRYLVKAERLFDVSPVTYPAYTQTNSSVRSTQEIEAFKAELRGEDINRTSYEKEAIKRKIEILKLK